MATAVRKHIAAKGIKKGQYVDCPATVKCRVGGEAQHVPISVFGAAKLWLGESRPTITESEIRQADIDAFLRDPGALDYVNRYEQQVSRQHLDMPWSYRSNYEYNLSGLDSAAFIDACDRFNTKNKTAEVTYDVHLQQHRQPAQVQMPAGLTRAPLPLNRDIYRFNHVQITGNPDKRELQRLERVLQVFVTGKADAQPPLGIFKTPQV